METTGKRHGVKWKSRTRGKRGWISSNVSRTVVNGKLTRIDKRQRQFAVGRQALYIWDGIFSLVHIFSLFKIYFKYILHVKNLNKMFHVHLRMLHADKAI
jgi:hypothetical protein